MEDPSQRGGRWSAVRMAAAASVPILLILAAALAPDGFALRERRGPGRYVLPSTPVVFRFVLAGLGILVLLCGLWGVLQAARGLRGRPRPSWSKRARALFVFVAVVGLVFIVVSLLRRIEPADRPQAPPAAGATPTPADFTSQSRSLGLVITVLAGLALVAGALAVLRLVRPDRPVYDGDRATRALVEELLAGIEDLGSIDDPRTAVIACYARMTRALVASGLRPSRSDTPLELLHRVLVERRVAEPSVRRLTALFETAKFSDHPVDERMRAAAIHAVEDVRSQLWASERSTGLVLSGAP
jgi:hypothetical protein